MIDQEEISDADIVNRLVDHPRMYGADLDLIWNEVFPFPNGSAESLIWSKYAPGNEQILEIGCAREAQKRLQNPNFRHGGFMSANVGEIRNIETRSGHGFIIYHAPEEGDFHAEVKYKINQNNIFNKSDKLELKTILYKKFSNLIEQNCGL